MFSILRILFDYRGEFLQHSQYSKKQKDFSYTQVRSGMGAYAGAVRRRVHLATVLLRSPSGRRPGKRQDRHARIPQIRLHLTQLWSVWTPPRHGPAPRITTRKNPMGWSERRRQSKPVTTTYTYLGTNKEMGTVGTPSEMKCHFKRAMRNVYRAQTNGDKRIV